MPELRSSRAALATDGTRRTGLRRLNGHDRGAILFHLLDLDQADRARRFGVPCGDEAIAAYVEAIDFERSIVIAAADRCTGAIAGLAEVVALDRAAGLAEAAISVHPAWRRRGIGRDVLQEAVEVARSEGFSSIEFRYSPDNRPLMRLIGRLGARADLATGTARLDVRPPRSAHRDAPADMAA